MRDATAYIWAIAALLIILAAFFGYRQWLDRQQRPDGLTELDALHFQQTDIRRWVGSGLMLTIALLMISVSGTPARTRAAARLWGWTWLAVLVLLIVLLVLSLVDWIAITRYGRRHRSALRAEQRSFWAGLVRERRSPHRQNGHPPK